MCTTRTKRVYQRIFASIHTSKTHTKNAIQQPAPYLACEPQLSCLFSVSQHKDASLPQLEPECGPLKGPSSMFISGTFPSSMAPVWKIHGLWGQFPAISGTLTPTCQESAHTLFNLLFTSEVCKRPSGACGNSGMGRCSLRVPVHFHVGGRKKKRFTLQVKQSPGSLSREKSGLREAGL